MSFVFVHWWVWWVPENRTGIPRHTTRVSPHELTIYVENAGDFTVPMSAVEAVHSEKVVLNCAKLDKRLRHALGHAHDKAEPGA